MIILIAISSTVGLVCLGYVLGMLTDYLIGEK